MKPLLSDTSAVWTSGSVRKLRDRFPDRDLLVPTVVVSERLRHLTQKTNTSCPPATPIRIDIPRHGVPKSSFDMERGTL